MTRSQQQPKTVPKPVPTPSEVTQFYWDGAKLHRLLIQRCSDCGYYIHPPIVVCPKKKRRRRTFAHAE